MDNDSEPTIVKSPRKPRWLFLLLCLILAVAGYYWFVLARPLGSGPAGPSVSREPVQNRKTYRIWRPIETVLLQAKDDITGFLTTVLQSGVEL